ncbi:DUF2442 domain-containing protein [Pseudoflavonifractor phocaeensis]|uniref:DUF2442 domain-containing protein n=1 Tax=Pseudoflavonifractor phocaeensis TaxID=1870988 RepID=UPI0019581985|nr:DUF2442 domain-containing protein [Pseudoflavonifractor phocaeensis]MBM6885578.1 DUF2442 domain-containing protein [Pseudoflavonifractor phocaeensis]
MSGRPFLPLAWIARGWQNNFSAWKPVIRISGVRPLEGYKLWLRFNTGEARVFDFKPLLNELGFAPLQDPKVFCGVYIDYGVTVWNNGNIDIAPEYLYENSTPAEDRIV